MDLVLSDEPKIPDLFRDIDVAQSTEGAAFRFTATLGNRVK